MQFWLAPLHGITNYHFRNCLHRHVDGLNVAVTPFLPVGNAAQINVRRWVDVAPDNNRAFETIPQLIGNHASDFVDTIRELQKIGYRRFNWNIGCPSAQVVRKQRGCGIMPYPDRIKEVVRLVTSETECQFSIKMRLGLQNPAESLAILEQLNDYPLDFIAVHPRLGVQQYAGTPDLAQFQQLCQHTNHTIIYSGDIVDLTSYRSFTQQFPQIDTIMLGRGLLRNPFLAEELLSKELIPQNIKYQRFKLFYTDLKTTLLAARGEHGALSVLKELWHYFAVFFQLSPEKLQQLLRLTDFIEFHLFTKKIIHTALNQ